MNTILFLAAVGVAAPPVGILQCPETTVARGEVKSGPALVQTFELTHRGTGILTITGVQGVCGCIRQSLSIGVLQPGETTRLSLEVNTLTQPEGPNRWQVVVAYKVENPGQPIVMDKLPLQLTATLSRIVTVTPPQLAFSTSGSASQEVILKDLRAKPLTITRVSTSHPLLTATIGKPVLQAERGSCQTVTIALSPDYPAGHREESVLLLTDDPEYAELRVPVRILKRSGNDVVVSPERIDLRLGPDLQETSMLVQLRQNDGNRLEIASVESDVPGVKLKWSTGSGPVQTVRVSVTGSTAAQSGSCKVLVKLGGQEPREIVIPVTWKREN